MLFSTAGEWRSYDFPKQTFLRSKDIDGRFDLESLTNPKNDIQKKVPYAIGRPLFQIMKYLANIVEELPRDTS